MRESRFYLVGLMVSLFFLISVGTSNADWRNGVELRIDHTKIDEDLTNFPLRVHLGNSSGINSIDLTSIVDELRIDANDDFTGQDGAPPDSARWTTAGNPQIQNNQLRNVVANSVLGTR